MRTPTMLTLAAALLAVAACTAGPTPEKPTATLTTSSAFLRPTPEQEKALLTALRAIDPGLVWKDSSAISRSVGVCDDIRKGMDKATVVKNAAFRYDGGHASVDEAKGAKIVQAIKNAYCTA